MRKKAHRSKRRDIFTSLGEVKIIEGRKRWVPFSIHYLNDCVSRLPVGRKVSATFSEIRALRSDPQLRYHWVLMGYLADHTGYTKEEMHEAVMRLKFGEKEVILAGQSVKVRKSISGGADLEKWEAVELIEYDLSLCTDLDIRVPSPEELGYSPN